MTKKDITVCFMGGDKRQMYAAESLSEYIKINTVGNIFEGTSRTNIFHFDNPYKAIHGVDAIILPLPAAMSESILPFSELVKHIKSQTVPPLLIGGKFSPYLKGVLESDNLGHIDYYENECFTVKNAYLTAEGAIQLATNATEYSLRNSKCAIMGYGRIGKALGILLKSFNSETTVWARREESLALASENGLKVKKLSANNDMADLIKNADIIFNTVPERIISNETLLAMPSKTVLIELASLPGGFDPDIASQCEIKLIDGKGLPAKYAPRSAGAILSDTIIQYLKQEEIL